MLGECDDNDDEDKTINDERLTVNGERGTINGKRWKKNVFNEIHYKASVAK